MIIIEYLIFTFYLFFQFVMFSILYDVDGLDFNVNTYSRGFTAALLKQILSFWFTVNSVIMIAAILNTLFVKRFSIIFGIMLISVSALHIILCAYMKKYVKTLKIKEVLTACSDEEYDVSAIESYIHSYSTNNIYKKLISPLHNLIKARDSFNSTEMKEEYDKEVLNSEIEIFIKNFEYMINIENEKHKKDKVEKEFERFKKRYCF